MNICFAGIDGAGKSSLARLLKTRLSAHTSHRVELFEETRTLGWDVLDAISRQTFGSSGHRVFGEDMHLVRAIDFIYEHCQLVPRLRSLGYWAVFSRSIYCYLAWADAMGYRKMEQLRAVYATCVTADVLVYVDVKPEVAFQRILRRGGKEEESLKELAMFRKAYECHLPTQGVIRLTNDGIELTEAFDLLWSQIQCRIAEVGSISET